MRFGLNLSLAKKNELSFQLRNSAGKDLGMSITFSRYFLNDKAAWFLRLTKDAKDSHIEGGLSLPW